MSMTMTQKILAAHAGKKAVAEGDLIDSKVDLVMGSDVTAPIALMEMQRYKLDGVFDRDKVVLVMDHFTPNKDIQAARNCVMVREFAKRHGLSHFYDVGCMGIEHAFLPEQGFIAPGELIIAADSHTCTYGSLNAFATGVGSTDMAFGAVTGTSWFKVPSAILVRLNGKPAKYIGGKDAILTLIGMIGVDGARYQSIEFAGDGVAHFSMDDRFAICNMVIEAGAKNGIFPMDAVTETFLKGRVSRAFTPVTADPDAAYSRVIDIDLNKLEPVVAAPHLPSNVKRAKNLAGVKIDQVVIGSCSNGYMTDLRMAADILRRKKIAKGMRCIVIPATQKIYLDAMREGLLEIFVEAGAVVSTPTCGPCNGGHMGVLADNERCVSTTNRNFVGRMGAMNSEVYLAGPAVAAASALTGSIAIPA